MSLEVPSETKWIMPGADWFVHGKDFEFAFNHGVNLIIIIIIIIMIIDRSKKILDLLVHRYHSLLFGRDILFFQL
jgi:hypothetical protein